MDMNDKKIAVASARNWREERISKIQNDVKVPSLVLHIVPFSAFEPSNTINLKNAINNRGTNFTLSGDDSFTIDFNGLHIKPKVHIRPSKYSTSTKSYNRLFHSGCIELVLTLDNTKDEDDCDDAISINTCAQNLKNRIPLYIKSLSVCGIKAPIIISVALVNVSGYTAQLENTEGLITNKSSIIESNLYFTESIIDSVPSKDEEYGVLLKSTIDHMANLTGALEFPDK
jgi:hypothetical protein